MSIEPMEDPINALQRIMVHGGQEMFDIAPMALQNILEGRMWEGRLDHKGIEFRDFEHFATSIRWQGLETSIEDLRLLCRKDRYQHVRAMLDAEIGALAEHGANQHTVDVDIVNKQQTAEGGRFARPEFNNVKDGDYNVGNSRAYTLNRLRRDAPELFNAVVAGDLSANAAAIEAGFRRKPTPLETMMRAWAKASEDERAAFRDYIDTPVMDRRQ